MRAGSSMALIAHKRSQADHFDARVDRDQYHGLTARPDCSGTCSPRSSNALTDVSTHGLDPGASALSVCGGSGSTRSSSRDPGARHRDRHFGRERLDAPVNGPAATTWTSRRSSQMSSTLPSDLLVRLVLVDYGLHHLERRQPGIARRWARRSALGLDLGTDPVPFGAALAVRAWHRLGPRGGRDTGASPTASDVLTDAASSGLPCDEGGTLRDVLPARAGSECVEAHRVEDGPTRSRGQPRRSGTPW